MPEGKRANPEPHDPWCDEVPLEAFLFSVSTYTENNVRHMMERPHYVQLCNFCRLEREVERFLQGAI